MSLHERFFLEMLRNPCDAETRNVYADFLEEKGDPRSEYVRLASMVNELEYFGWLEESTHAHYTRTFSELKEAANQWNREKPLREQLVELRSGFDTEWLAFMDSFGRLKRPFEFINNTGPSSELKTPSHFASRSAAEALSLLLIPISTLSSTVTVESSKTWNCYAV